MDRELSVRKLYLGIQDKKIMDGDMVSMYGWVKSARNNGNVGFIEFNDGTHFKGVQLVFVKDQNALMMQQKSNMVHQLNSKAK